MGRNNQSVSDSDDEHRFNEAVEGGDVQKEVQIIVAEVKMQVATEQAQGGH